MKVNMMHGAGGEVMGELLQTLTKFTHNNAGGIGLESLDDGAVIPINGTNIVFTTDSHVVRPIFFPGGDIGRIAVSGTVNDLAMMGGRPVALSCGMILEEGFDVADLEKIVCSMDEALGEAGACLVTGDTKVVEKGALDGIAINTAGIGVAKTIVRDNGLVPGDVIIVSGTLGDHGIAIMAHREGFDLGEQILSDVAPLWGMMEPVLDAGTIHAMKDPTRGGFASAINEMAKKSHVQVRIEEGAYTDSQKCKKRCRDARHRPARSGKRGQSGDGCAGCRCRCDPCGTPLAQVREGSRSYRQSRRRFPRDHGDGDRWRTVH